MFYEASRSTLRLHTAVLLIGIFSLMVPAASASGLETGQDSKAASVASSSTDAGASTHSGPAMSVGINSESEGSDAQSSGANTPQATSKQPGTSSTSAPSPLTPRGKFKYFARSSFMPPMPYALSVLSGVFSEATDKDHGRHMTAGDFMADSMTHAARSFAFRATANLFEKFAFASAFKQDPRYFRSDKTGFGRFGYAVSRVFITRSDNGNDQFNASFLAGGLVAAGISNVWSRPEDRTVSSTLGRFGIHVAYKALSNVIQELFREH